MKVAILTVLPLLAAGMAIQSSIRHTPDAPNLETPLISHPELPHGLEKRQIWDWLGSKIQQTLPGWLRWATDNITWMLKMQESPLKRVQMQPQPVLGNKAKKVALKYGPWLLTGSNETNPLKIVQMDPKSTVIMRTLRGIPGDAAIMSSKPSLIFEDGSPATFAEGIYIHHFLIADMSKPAAPFALCPKMNKDTPLGLWAAGYVLEAVGAGLVQVGNDAVYDPNLYFTKTGKIKSGFLTNKDDLFFMEAEIVNYYPSNRTVYLNLELEYFDADDKQAYLDSTPDIPVQDGNSHILDASTVIVSAEGCNAPGYMPPPKSKKYTHVSDKFELNQDGWIVNARGHLHDGGTAIDLELNETLICRSLPRYGKPAGSGEDRPDTILDMSWCHDPVRVRKGDYLVVKSHYDLEEHELRKGVGGGGAMHGTGHGGNSSPMGSSNGHAMSGKTMEGMEEMGIFTTNFAWLEPPNKAAYPTNGFSFGSSAASSSKASADAKSISAAISSGTGQKPSKQPPKEENPLASLIPQAQGTTSLSYDAISPQTVGAQQDAADKAAQNGAKVAGLFMALLTAKGLNSLLNVGLGGQAVPAAQETLKVKSAQSVSSLAAATIAGPSVQKPASWSWGLFGKRS